MLQKRLGIAIGLILLGSLLLWATNGGILWSLTYPFVAAWSGAHQAINHQSEQWALQSRLLEENRQLKEKSQQMESQLARLNELEKENARLQELLRAAREVSRPSQSARVLYRTPGNWLETLVAGKGRTSGVKENSVVLSARGIVGKVIRVDEATCVVRLISDPQMEISAISQRSRDVIILQGNYSKELKGKLIPPQVDLQKGDLLLSSGLGGIYPKGVPIGQISWISKNDADPNPKIKVDLAANLNHLEEVLIVSPVEP